MSVRCCGVIAFTVPRADRHEDRRFDHAVVQMQTTATGVTVGGEGVQISWQTLWDGSRRDLVKTIRVTVEPLQGLRAKATCIAITENRYRCAIAWA